MNEEQLAAFYAGNARRWETAKREFAEREHGWHFALAPEAGRWADSFAAAEAAATGYAQDPSAWATRLVEQADAAGVILKPEPGRIRSAYAHRDSRTETETAIGFGFSPDSSEVLVVHAGQAVPHNLIAPAVGSDGAAALAVLRAVVDAFATVTAFA
ncbi:hypothetical protein [Catenulispora subtropica]|uniref:Uncharacterized protein n=1 Tax=Catenulispora subtropica TaxID=450798 RepID=A0ABN2TEL9_9ACTN